MLKSSLCDYSDTYILVKGSITVPNTGTAAAPNSRNIKVIFKNNAQVDNAKDIDVAVVMCNLTECSNIYLETPGSLWKYCRDELALNNAGSVIDFSANNNSVSCKSIS